MRGGSLQGVDEAPLPLYETFLANMWPWRHRLFPLRMDTSTGLQAVADAAQGGVLEPLGVKLCAISSVLACLAQILRLQTQEAATVLSAQRGRRQLRSSKSAAKIGDDDRTSDEEGDGAAESASDDDNM